MGICIVCKKDTEGKIEFKHDKVGLGSNSYCYPICDECFTLKIAPFVLFPMNLVLGLFGK